MKLSCLAIYPNQWGFGYAFFSNPQSLKDYGIRYIQPHNTEKTLCAISNMITKYNPESVVTRGFNTTNTASKRIKILVDRICATSKEESISVHQYTRDAIRKSFEKFEVISKRSISERLIAWFPELSIYAYPKRKRWKPEHHNAGVFDAVSLAMTFYENKM